MKKRMSWIGHVECMRKLRNMYKVVIRESEWKRPLARPRHKWEYNIKMNLE
jgi:hypothetical protein